MVNLIPMFLDGTKYCKLNGGSNLYKVSGLANLLNENKKQYVGILPGSMRGNKKRNNYVELNSVVLINNRSSWQTAKEMSQADIVHVYSSMHIRELKLHEKFQEQLNKHNNNGSILDKNYITFDNNATTVDEKKKEIIISFD